MNRRLYRRGASRRRWRRVGKAAPAQTARARAADWAWLRTPRRRRVWPGGACDPVSGSRCAPPATRPGRRRATFVGSPNSARPATARSGGRAAAGHRISVIVQLISEFGEHARFYLERLSVRTQLNCGRQRQAIVRKHLLYVVHNGKILVTHGEANSYRLLTHWSGTVTAAHAQATTTGTTFLKQKLDSLLVVLIGQLPTHNATIKCCWCHFLCNMFNAWRVCSRIRLLTRFGFPYGRGIRIRKSAFIYLCIPATKEYLLDKMYLKNNLEPAFPTPWLPLRPCKL